MCNLHVQLPAWANTLFSPDRRCHALADTMRFLDLYDLANMHGQLD